MAAAPMAGKGLATTPLRLTILRLSPSRPSLARPATRVPKHRPQQTCAYIPPTSTLTVSTSECAGRHIFWALNDRSLTLICACLWIIAAGPTWDYDRPRKRNVATSKPRWWWPPKRLGACYPQAQNDRVTTACWIVSVKPMIELTPQPPPRMTDRVQQRLLLHPTAEACQMRKDRATGQYRAMWRQVPQTMWRHRQPQVTQQLPSIPHMRLQQRPLHLRVPQTRHTHFNSHSSHIYHRHNRQHRNQQPRCHHQSLPGHPTIRASHLCLQSAAPWLHHIKRRRRAHWFPRQPTPRKLGSRLPPNNSTRHTKTTTTYPLRTSFSPLRETNLPLTVPIQHGPTNPQKWVSVWTGFCSSPAWMFVIVYCVYAEIVCPFLCLTFGDILCLTPCDSFSKWPPHILLPSFLLFFPFFFFFFFFFFFPLSRKTSPIHFSRFFFVFVFVFVTQLISISQPNSITEWMPHCCVIIWHSCLPSHTFPAHRLHICSLSLCCFFNSIPLSLTLQLFLSPLQVYLHHSGFFLFTASSNKSNIRANGPMSTTHQFK